MKIIRSLELALFFVSFLQFGWASDSRFYRVERDISAYDEHQKSVEQEFQKMPSNLQDKEWVKKKIRHLFDLDQYMRKFWDTPFKNHYSADEKVEFDKEFIKKNNALDSKNTEELKVLLKMYRWFTITDFGSGADDQAWLLVQHADQDPGFQGDVLQILEGLSQKGETKPEHYAYLFDRVAGSFTDPTKSRPQRFGTQGECKGPGKWEPFPIEDPKHLDERRKSVGLESESDYIQRFKTICH